MLMSHGTNIIIYKYDIIYAYHYQPNKVWFRPLFCPIFVMPLRELSSCIYYIAGS
jgi:hypothetical protein